MRRSASRIKPSGTVCGRPLLAPMVVSKSTGISSQPLAVPPLVRNSAMNFWLYSLSSLSLGMRLLAGVPIGGKGHIHEPSVPRRAEGDAGAPGDKDHVARPAA